MANKITIEFSLEKETPGALRYAETKNGKPVKISDGAKIGTLYLRKDGISGQPDKLKVTVEY